MAKNYPGPAQSQQEELTFTIRPIATRQEFESVLMLRQRAYARHDAYQEGFLSSLKQADDLDLAGVSTVLGAFDKQSGELLGTVRLTSSMDKRNLLPEEVPAAEVTDVAFTFIDRFAAAAGAPRLVAPAMMKAIWLWSKLNNSQTFVALATRPLVRHYLYWGSMRHQGHATPIIVASDLKEPVYLLGAWVKDALPDALENNYGFWEFLEADHADIQVVAHV